MPVIMVFRRELHLPCDLLFRAPPDKEHSTTGHVADRMDWLHDINHYACQHLKVASEWIKVHYDRLANSMGFQEGDQRLSCPTKTRGKSLKLQPSWVGPFSFITQINDMVYRIQRHPRVKMVVVRLDKLAPRVYSVQTALRREQCYKHL
jgi:hypothetical protein